MNKKRIIALLIIAISVFGVLVYTGKIKLIPKLKVVKGTGESITVRIPVGDEFLDVDLDSDNSLVETNELSIWNYSNASIYVTQSKPSGRLYQNGIYFKKDMIWKKFGDYYICVREDRNRLKPTLQSFEENTLINSVHTLKEENNIGMKPKYSIPKDYVINNNDTICPRGTSSKLYDKWLDITKHMESVKKPTNAVTHYDMAGYFNSKLSYIGYVDVLGREVSKLVELSQNTDCIWYTENDATYVESGDRYLGVRKINLNTTLVVTGKGKEYKDFILATTFGLNK